MNADSPSRDRETGRDAVGPPPRRRPVASPLRGLGCSRLVALAATTAFAGCGKGTASATSAETLPQVEVALPLLADVPVYDERVGEVSGIADVEVRARVEGFLESVEFQEGSFVEKKAPLYVIDRSQTAAALRKAQADVASERAAFVRAEADVRTSEASVERLLAEVTAERARTAREGAEVRRLEPLVSTGAVSGREFDDARAKLDAGRAAVGAAEAAVTAARAQVASSEAAVGVAQARVDAAVAAVDRATLEDGYTRISAPITGYVGMTRARPGALVGRGESNLLTTVSDISSVLVRVHASQRDYLRLRTRLGETSASQEVRLRLADGSEYPEPGTFVALDRAADPTTGTVALQFRFPNPDAVLRPGLTARVRFRTDVHEGVLLVPERALSQVQSLTRVVVVDGQGVAHVRPVTLGPKWGHLRTILSGISGTDQVVVAGLQRAADGKMVAPRLVVTPPPGSAVVKTR